MEKHTEVGVTELRQNIRKHIRQAAEGRPVVVTHDGYPQAVLVSVDQWRALTRQEAQP